MDGKVKIIIAIVVVIVVAPLVLGFFGKDRAYYRVGGVGNDVTICNTEWGDNTEVVNYPHTGKGMSTPKKSKVERTITRNGKEHTVVVHWGDYAVAQVLLDGTPLNPANFMLFGVPVF